MGAKCAALAKELFNAVALTGESTSMTITKQKFNKEGDFVIYLSFPKSNNDSLKRKNPKLEKIFEDVRKYFEYKAIKFTGDAYYECNDIKGNWEGVRNAMTAVSSRNHFVSVFVPNENNSDNSMTKVCDKFKTAYNNTQIEGECEINL